MSTTKKRHIEMEYVCTVLCIETSTTNNDVVIVEFSQYPGEEETVWNVCSFVQHMTLCMGLRADGIPINTQKRERSTREVKKPFQ